MTARMDTSARVMAAIGAVGAGVTSLYVANETIQDRHLYAAGATGSLGAIGWGVWTFFDAVRPTEACRSIWKRFTADRTGGLSYAHTLGSLTIGTFIGANLPTSVAAYAGITNRVTSAFAAAAGTYMFASLYQAYNGAMSYRTSDFRSSEPRARFWDAPITPSQRRAIAPSSEDYNDWIIGLPSDGRGDETLSSTYKNQGLSTKFYYPDSQIKEQLDEMYQRLIRSGRTHGQAVLELMKKLENHNFPLSRLNADGDEQSQTILGKRKEEGERLLSGLTPDALKRLAAGRP